MKWYAIQAQTNYENKVSKAINEEKDKNGCAEVIEEALAPEEKVESFEGGKKVVRTKKLYPGYVFVKMEFSDVAWHFIKKIKGVINFIGESKLRPTPISDKEMERIKNMISQGVPKPKVVYEIDQRIMINNGSFKDFYGVVKEVNYDKNKIKVGVVVFNRETEVVLSLSDVEPSNEK